MLSTAWEEEEGSSDLGIGTSGSGAGSGAVSPGHTESLPSPSYAEMPKIELPGSISPEASSSGSGSSTPMGSEGGRLQDSQAGGGVLGDGGYSGNGGSVGGCSPGAGRAPAAEASALPEARSGDAAEPRSEAVFSGRPAGGPEPPWPAAATAAGAAGSWMGSRLPLTPQRPQPLQVPRPRPSEGIPTRVSPKIPSPVFNATAPAKGWSPRSSFETPGGGAGAAGPLSALRLPAPGAPTPLQKAFASYCATGLAQPIIEPTPGGPATAPSEAAGHRSPGLPAMTAPAKPDRLAGQQPHPDSSPSSRPAGLPKEGATSAAHRPSHSFEEGSSLGGGRDSTTNAVVPKGGASVGPQGGSQAPGVSRGGAQGGEVEGLLRRDGAQPSVRGERSEAGLSAEASSFSIGGELGRPIRAGDSDSESSPLSNMARALLAKNVDRWGPTSPVSTPDCRTATILIKQVCS